ncbi:MAG: restriction endonuclease subunit S [Acidimicrobiia bacterium]|nr:restriction endonuclease subunit S [Acidimicrobiia bacterium]
MSEWREVTLGDLVDLFDHKRVPLSTAQRSTRAGPYPYYGAQGVIDHIDDYIFDGRFILIPEDGENLRSRKLPIAYFAEGRFWVNNHAHIVKAKPGVAMDRFVQSAIEASDIGPFVTGAAQPKLSQANLRRLPLRVPPLAEQSAIASILDAIDDLIENNRRRVEVLEEMARAIYREWFVRFRFPGHEDVPLVDSPLGLFPEGWRTVRLADSAQVTMGQSPKSEFYNGEGVGTPFHQGVTDFGSHYPTHRKYCTVQKRLADEGDVLVSVRAPVGRLNIADRTLVIGRGLAAVRSRRGHQNLLLGNLKEVFSEEDSMGGGTIFKAIGKAELEGLQVLEVPEALAQLAEAHLAAKSDLIRSLTFSTRRLTALRDLLLPKLVTGQIDVSDLDLDALVEGSAA